MELKFAQSFRDSQNPKASMDCVEPFYRVYQNYRMATVCVRVRKLQSTPHMRKLGHRSCTLCRTRRPGQPIAPQKEQN